MLLITQRNQRAKEILKRYSIFLLQQILELKSKRIKDTVGLSQAPKFGTVIHPKAKLKKKKIL